MVLDLSHNELRGLPPAVFSSWEHLRILRLQKNYLPSIPSEIKQVKNLTELYLQFNHLETLTPDIGHLKDMKVLKIHNNLLTELPPPLGIMHSLEELTVLPTKKKRILNTSGSTPGIVNNNSNQKEDAPATTPPSSSPASVVKAEEGGGESTASSDQVPTASPGSSPARAPLVGWEETYKLRITSPPPDVLHLGINDILSFLCQLLNGSER